MENTTFKKTHNDSILIIQEWYHGTNYMEVSCEFSRKDFTISKYNYRLMMNSTDSLANWQGRNQACNYFGEDTIGEAETKLTKQIRSLRGIIAKGKKHPAYKLMKAEFKRVVKFYHDDFLFHDTLRMGIENPDKFIWVVRSCGTWFIAEKESVSILEYNVAHPDNANDYYFWSGNEFYKLDSAHALTLAHSLYN